MFEVKRRFPKDMVMSPATPNYLGIIELTDKRNYIAYVLKIYNVDKELRSYTPDPPNPTLKTVIARPHKWREDVDLDNLSDSSLPG